MGPFSDDPPEVDTFDKDDEYNKYREELQIQEETSIFILLLILVFGMMGTFVVRLLFF